MRLVLVAASLLLAAAGARGDLAPSPGVSAEEAEAAGRQGDLEMREGNYEAAERAYRRSLKYHEAAQPGGAETARLLYLLAEIAVQRLDLSVAEGLYRRSLAVYERLDPMSHSVADAYNGLGAVARLLDDWPAAEAAFEHALTLMERVAPDSRPVVVSLAGMTIVALDRGQVDRAEELLARAAAVGEACRCGGHVPALLTELKGRVAWIRDEPEAAQTLLERAVEMYARQLPGSLVEAEAVFALGWTHRQLGRTEKAADYFCRLIDLVEGSKLRIGGGEEQRAVLAGKFGDYYNDCLDLLVDLGRGAEAFHRLEGARARRFLARLAERELDLVSEAPRDVEDDLRELRREHDRVQGRLWNLPPEATAAEAEALRGRLAELRRAADAAIQEIRRRAPRLGALRYPEPLDLARAQAALDGGTLLLSYSVTATHTLLFAVSTAGLAVHRIPLGRDALYLRVEAFRDLIERGRVSGDLPGALLEQGGALYRDLVGPEAAAVDAADRLLVCPDGPLHGLPFGALVPGSPGERPRFLVESKPIHLVLSATVYAELRARRRSDGGRGAVVAFGDPRYPGPPAAGDATPFRDAELQAAVRGGLRLSPLPATRDEVEALQRLFPEATAWLGHQATEERVKSLRTDLRYLHFACHGYLDEVQPLNSGLVLTLRAEPGEGEDNGLLQAWEVLESVWTDAELVTLSACASGTGPERVGEGLAGLTRAFHHAGARTVLASLWSVADESTADLMGRFYGALQSGATKDAALATAQRELIRGGRYAHPFHWAAFQITGDWK